MELVIRNLLTQLAAVVACALFLQSCSGVVIGSTSAPPPPPPEVVTLAPSSRHVWIPGRYVYRRSGYTWRHGHYRVPPPRRPVFVPGHWESTSIGYMWRDGYWVRRSG